MRLVEASIRPEDQARNVLRPAPLQHPLSEPAPGRAGAPRRGARAPREIGTGGLTGDAADGGGRRERRPQAALHETDAATPSYSAAATAGHEALETAGRNPAGPSSISESASAGSGGTRLSHTMRSS